MVTIEENVKNLLRQLPGYVELVAAAKTRSPQEIRRAIEGGIKIIGENYVQEAEKALSIIGHKVKWHLIGHLQKNKVKKAVKVFDLIQTVDSTALAEEIDKICAGENKIMPVFVEINSGKEKQKFGVMPDEAEELIKELVAFKNIRVMGLMTMGANFSDPEKTRPYFQQTKKIFDQISSRQILGVEMKYLSMGMTNSYRVAIEEGANMVRIGSKIFGPREEG